MISTCMYSPGVNTPTFTVIPVSLWCSSTQLLVLFTFCPPFPQPLMNFSSISSSLRVKSWYGRTIRTECLQSFVKTNESLVLVTRPWYKAKFSTWRNKFRNSIIQVIAASYVFCCLICVSCKWSAILNVLPTEEHDGLHRQGRIVLWENDLCAPVAQIIRRLILQIADVNLSQILPITEKIKLKSSIS